MLIKAVRKELTNEVFTDAGTEMIRLVEIHKVFDGETVLNHIANIEDTTGRPIWRRPTEAMPGRLDLYPYHEVSILPQIADIKPGEPFAIFMNPKRIQHGNRKGIEIKKFDGTTESMEYGELFLRFRKRDGFLVTRPKNNILVLKTKSE